MTQAVQQADLKAPQSEKSRVTADSSGGALPANGSDGGVTLTNQHKLPKLPIPPLQDTCKRYIRALEGLQSPSDHEKTKKVVAEFLEKEGPALHDTLVNYAADKHSFIEEFWDAAYLDVVDSVVLNLNPFFILEDDPTPARGNQLMRATSLILASLGFVHDLRTGQLQPDMFRKIPLDMHQYTRLFGTARIPTDKGCKMTVEPESKHIVVLRRGQLYWFDVLDSHHRPALTERELLRNLEAIIADADKTPPGQVAQGAIGVLTTENRGIWAKHRQTLQSNSRNKMCLDVVDTALFMVCLDDSSPETVSENCTNMLCGTYRLEKGVQTGTCTNRWYDKLQIIVAANGAAGVNFEHSGVDGHTVLRYVADIYSELILLFAKSINSACTTLFKAKTSPWAKGAGKKTNGHTDEHEEFIDSTPQKLEWSLTPEVRNGIRFAETRIGDLICQSEIVAMEFDTYGKNFITRHGFSPDAFVQMAYQAAYYTLYGRTVCTYEPAMTKAFLHGRTEAIRTVQPESVDFVKAYCSDAPIAEKLKALRKACKAHVEITKNCSQGLGQDRILYAMYNLAKQNAKGDTSKIPAIFSDPGYSTLGHSILSTSNCGNPALRLFGFGPVVSDGFGLGYIIKDDAIAICASSKHLQTQRFLNTLKTYFLDVQKSILQAHRQANERPDYSFVDHYGGQVDSRTGHPISHYSAEDHEDELMGGYGFYGSEEVNPHASPKTPSRRHVGTKLHIKEY